MFRKLFSTFSIFASAAVLLASNSFAVEGQSQWRAKPITVRSQKPFDQTVDNVKKLVAKSGMMVMGEINQGGIMAMTGTSLKAVSLFVGSPAVGKKLFKEDVGCAVAAPFRVTIYENEAGKTIISYYKPSDLLSAFDGEAIGSIAGMLDQKLAMLSSDAGK